MPDSTCRAGQLRSNFSQSVTMGGGLAASAAQKEQHAHHPANDEDSGCGTDGGRAGCLKFCADKNFAGTKSNAVHAEVAGPNFAAGIQWHQAARFACHSTAAGPTVCFCRAAVVYPLAALDDLTRPAAARATARLALVNRPTRGIPPSPGDLAACAHTRFFFDPPRPIPRRSP